MKTADEDVLVLLQDLRMPSMRSERHVSPHLTWFILALWYVLGLVLGRCVELVVMQVFKVMLENPSLQ